MSASSTGRRLSLLTGSSIFAALVLTGTGAVLLTPATALAANECGNPSANAATADTFQCTGTFDSITYPATDGNLTLQLQNNVITTAGGLVVTPTGANNVTINRIADSPENSGDPSLTSTTGAGISVTRDVGGTINVNLTDNDTTDEALVISGTTAGVLLRNAGTANTTFTSTNGKITASAGAGIDVSTVSVAAGNLTVTNGSDVSGSTYGIRAGTAGTGAIAITNNGSITGTTGAVLVTGGLNATLTNAATRSITGAVTFNNTGTVTFTNNGTWIASGASTLGAGTSTLTNSATGLIQTSGTSSFDFSTAAATFNDTFANAGTLAAGWSTEGASELTFTGLERWNNSNRVMFGASADLISTDGAPDDRIVSAGTVFTGSVNSRLIMDVDFSADQADCSAAVVADCLDLRGGSTAGSTAIVVNGVGAGGLGERIVLIDVGGAGTSAATHFTLSDQSTGYRLVGSAGAVEDAMFLYTLQYDSAAKQHVLGASAFGGRAPLALSRISRAASEPWRTATGMWQDRQLDLRDTLAGRDSGGGAWLKVAGNAISEDRHDTLEVGGEASDYNTSASQKTVALVGGIDLVRMSGADSALVLGLTAGKLSSTLDYRTVNSELELDGHSLGAYATWVAGPLFVDAIVNQTVLDLTYNAFGRDFEGSASSVGFQVEGAYRLFEINDGGGYVEPLAAFSYVKTDVDDLTVGPVDAIFDEASSLRAALGVRVAGGMEMDDLTARLSFTGRVWKEFEGDNGTTLGAGFGDFTLADTGLDTLGDVGLALGLFSPGGRLSANLGYRLTFGEGYHSSDASLGVRFSF